MVLLDYYESDGEDSAISLSDLPVTESLDGAVNSPPSPLEHFEFHPSAAAAAMCSADDVISSGKLLPFRSPDPLPAKTEETHIAYDVVDSDHRRCSSMGDRPVGFFGSSGYRRLRRVAGPDPIRPRPKWYQMAFGSVRVPAGMEMSEIRMRQRRRSSSVEATEVSGSWKLLRSLSCKGVEVAGDCHGRIVF